MGRPRKYQTDEDRLVARRAQTRAHVQDHRSRRRKAQTNTEAGASLPTSSEAFDNAEYGGMEEVEHITIRTSSPGTSLLRSVATLDRPVVTRPIDYADYSLLPGIRVSFGALRQLANDLHYGTSDRRSPKFPFLQLLPSSGSNQDTCTARAQLVDLSVFITAAQRMGMDGMQPALLHLAAQGRYILLQRLRKHIERGSELQMQNYQFYDGADPREAFALITANESLLLTYLREPVLAASTDNSDNVASAAAGYLYRVGVEMIQAIGPTAFRTGIGWWILRLNVPRIMHLAVFDRKATFLDDPEWLRTMCIPSDLEDDLNGLNICDQVNDPVATFWTVVAMVPRLMECAKALVLRPSSLPQQTALLSLQHQIVELHTDLRSWWLSCRQTLPDVLCQGLPVPAWIVAIEETEGFTNLFRASLWFADRRTAGVLIAYWMYTVHVALLLEQIRSHMVHPLPTMSRILATPSSSTHIQIEEIINTSEDFARRICCSVQYMVESLDMNPDLGAFFYSDNPAVALHVAEVFFAAKPLKFDAELKWVCAVTEALSTLNSFSACSWRLQTGLSLN